MKEEKIIIDAIDQLKNITGIIADWEAIGAKNLDGVIAFKYNGRNYKTYVEVKKEFRNHQLPLLIKLKEEYQPLMVIAENIFPKIKEELRKLDIGYLETNGNVFFKFGDVFIWRDGQKKINKNKIKAGRAFTKTGLKVIFHFLLNPQLVRQTYREIANTTGIGFGNINFIMTDLKEQGFLIPLDKHTHKLTHKKELLNKWMHMYEMKLKPDLLIGKFRFLKEGDFLNWKELPVKNRKVWWGGEPAGDLLTNYLQPEELTLYTEEKRNELILRYRLIPDEKGNIKVYQKFWQQDTGNEKEEGVPPLLTYVDLMNTNDRRCIETAEKVYNDYLHDKF